MTLCSSSQKPLYLLKGLSLNFSLLRSIAALENHVLFIFAVASISPHVSHVEDVWRVSVIHARLKLAREVTRLCIC